MTTAYRWTGLVFKDPTARKTLERLTAFARFGSPLLLTGEAGTGKRETARLYHRVRWERDDGFVHLSAGNLSADLAYTELFGYRKGAFSGADSDRPGAADRTSESGSTLYLSSLELLPSSLFTPLVELIESHRFQPLGDERSKEYRGGLVLSSPLSLEGLKELLPPSLFYALNAYHIPLPPLRERPKDILPLAKFFLKELNRRGGIKKDLDPEMATFLQAYTFPGNLRELRNLLESAYISGQEESLLRLAHLSGVGSTPPSQLLKEAMEERWTYEELEKRYFLEVYKREGGRRKRIASSLGITARSVYNLLLKYGLAHGKDQGPLGGEK